MTTTPELTFGALLQRYRKAAGLSQEELAERAGIGVRTISDLERGVAGRPQKHTLSLLAGALDLDGAGRAAFAAAARQRPDTTTSLSLASPAPPTPTRATLPALPGYLTALVGRDRERAAVCRLLRGPSVRLLTLTGVGGVGKTRLVVQVAEDLADDFPDGVAFISLAPVADSALVLPTIAHTLGVRQAAAVDARDALIGALRSRTMLLVLDNMEHVAAAAPDLAALVVACRDLRLLVTSRVALRVHGEQAFPIPPLAVPDGSVATTWGLQQDASLDPVREVTAASSCRYTAWAKRCQAAMRRTRRGTGAVSAEKPRRRFWISAWPRASV
jgi:transcriptional regulator with XRE-family HTH domain